MKNILKTGIASVCALAFGIGVALADPPTAADNTSLNSAIASGDKAALREKCQSIDNSMRQAAPSDKTAWRRLRDKCESALGPKPGPGPGGALIPGPVPVDPPVRPPKKKDDNNPPPPPPPVTFVPPAPVLPAVTVPPFFCSEGAKQRTLDELFRQANAVREYMDVLWDLLGKSNKTSRDNLIAGDPALIRAYKDALHEHQMIDKLYDQAKKTKVKDCTLEEHSMAPVVPPMLVYAKSFIAIDGGITFNQFRFGDGFESSHTGGSFGMRGGMDWNASGNWTIGWMAGLYGQAGRAEKQGLETSINWYGTAEAKIATDINPEAALMRRALRLWGSAGFAFGEIENQTPTFKQSVVAPGWTGAVGINYEFQPSWNFGLTYRYVHLGPKQVDGLRTDVKADSSQIFISLQKNFLPW